MRASSHSAGLFNAGDVTDAAAALDLESVDDAATTVFAAVDALPTGTCRGNAPSLRAKASSTCRMSDDDTAALTLKSFEDAAVPSVNTTPTESCSASATEELAETLLPSMVLFQCWL